MILDDKTIVAIATPVGVGAIAIVRLSGEEAYSIALSLTHRQALKPRYAHLCQIHDLEQTPIDEALVLYFPKPHSYTTQDVCEIQCHGGLVSARAIVELCVALGARVAHAGEFTKRAYLGGRLDLAQTQAIAALINSQSLEANKILMRNLKGALGDFVQSTRERLLGLMALSEVNIDYSEEVEEDFSMSMRERLGEIRASLERVYRFSQARVGLFDGFRLCIVGKPNVGKSSLLNALLMYERAIVSDVEGTTRDTIEESLSLGGSLVRLIDTAGIRKSADSIEQRGIERSREAMEQSDIILCLFDGSSALDERDFEILELLKAQREKHVLFVVNKSDLPQAEGTLSTLQNALDSEPLSFKPLAPTPLSISAKSHDVGQILQMIESALALHGGSEEILLTSTHQIECLQGALTQIDKASEVLSLGQLELFSYHIRDSVAAIAQITHPYEDSQLLDKLFGTFCLGK